MGQVDVKPRNWESGKLNCNSQYFVISNKLAKQLAEQELCQREEIVIIQVRGERGRKLEGTPK